MPVNHPPIKKDMVESTWDLEVTQIVNNNEERLRSLLLAIKKANSLDELKELVKDI